MQALQTALPRPLSIITIVAHFIHLNIAECDDVIVHGKFKTNKDNNCGLSECKKSKICMYCILQYKIKVLWSIYMDYVQTVFSYYITSKWWRFQHLHCTEVEFMNLQFRCFQLVHWLNSWILLVHSSSSNMFFKIAKWLLVNSSGDFEGIFKNYYFSDTVCFQLNSGQYNSSSKNHRES
jgi:hypothetical protein